MKMEKEIRKEEKDRIIKILKLKRDCYADYSESYEVLDEVILKLDNE